MLISGLLEHWSGSAAKCGHQVPNRNWSRATVEILRRGQKVTASPRKNSSRGAKATPASTTWPTWADARHDSSSEVMPIRYPRVDSTPPRRYRSTAVVASVSPAHRRPTSFLCMIARRSADCDGDGGTTFRSRQASPVPVSLHFRSDRPTRCMSLSFPPVQGRSVALLIPVIPMPMMESLTRLFWQFLSHRSKCGRIGTSLRGRQGAGYAATGLAGYCSAMARTRRASSRAW